MRVVEVAQEESDNARTKATFNLQTMFMAPNNQNKGPTHGRRLLLI